MYYQRENYLAAENFHRAFDGKNLSLKKTFYRVGIRNPVKILNPI